MDEMNRVSSHDEIDALIDAEITALRRERHAAWAEVDLLDNVLKRSEPHPHYHRFVLGGTGRAAAQDARHVVAMIGALATTATTIVPMMLESSSGTDAGLARLADLTRVLDGGASALAKRGRQVLHDRAAAAYHADCARFDAWQAETPDRTEWRALPPVSRQGHLARTTAKHRDIIPPVATSRGDAADWLADAGANIRFRKDNR